MKKYYFKNQTNTLRFYGHKLSGFKALYGEKLHPPSYKKHKDVHGDRLNVYAEYQEYNTIKTHSVYEIWNFGYSVYICPTLDFIWLDDKASTRYYLMPCYNPVEIWNSLNG